MTEAWPKLFALCIRGLLLCGTCRALVTGASLAAPSPLFPEPCLSSPTERRARQDASTDAIPIPSRLDQSQPVPFARTPSRSNGPAVHIDPDKRRPTSERASERASGSEPSIRSTRRRVAAKLEKLCRCAPARNRRQLCPTGAHFCYRRSPGSLRPTRFTT